MKLPPLKIVLKTKNEDFLIASWLEYYKNLVGEENIIVYDDDSTSEYVLDIYKKYKNIDFRRIPKDFAHIDRLHAYRKLHQEMQQTCMYYTILDTDEFLCFFDHTEKTINNAKLLDFILNNSHRDAFPTTWIFNLYDGTDFPKLTDVTNFNLQLNKVNIELGKIIASGNGAAGVNIGHNGCAGTHAPKKVKMQACPELLLLHVNNANWESRIKSKINLAKNFGAKFNTIEELLEQIKNKNKKTYYDIEIFEYYTNKENFLNKKTANKTNNHPVMTSDVFASWIESRGAAKTSFTGLNFDLYSHISGLFCKSFNKPAKFEFIVS